MTDNPAQSQTDVWSEWLLRRRHGEDPIFADTVRADVARYADRVLDEARLLPGMTLADIGTGDGLIAFRAIDRVGPSLQVILTDISGALLEHAEKLAIERHVQAQCRFVHGTAERLDAISDACVDVVTTRAVLAYVADKLAALREFHRILRPGGLISIAEPILQDDAFMATALRVSLEARDTPVQDRFLPLLHRWKAAQYPDTHAKIAESPICNYSERSLFELVRRAGFADTHLELHIDMLPAIITTWEVFLDSSPHPWAPPLSVILKEQFAPEERQFFEQIMRPMVESRQAVSISRIVYLHARKP